MTLIEKKKILIADDSEMNREILAEILGEEYEILEAENGAMAVAEMQRNSAEISMLLLDYVMPEMDGFQVLEVMNRKHWIEDIPVIMISAETSQTYMEQAYELGVMDFIARPFEALVIQRRVKNALMLYTKQRKLTDMVIEQIYAKERQSNLLIDILSHIVEFRNGESGRHVLNIHILTEVMLKQLMRITDKYALTNEEITRIITASALHDVGKISIPDEILNKPGRLTPEEFAVMKTHSLMGAKMIEAVPQFETEPLVKTAYEICRWHHERYDGRGYPDGLKGDDIPIGAQIVALADVYDALTSDRVYKRAFSHEVAVDMILDGQCGAFSPQLLECLKMVAPTLREELDHAATTNMSERRMRAVTQELMLRSDLSASSHPLGLLERERTKFSFFANMARDVWFEFSAAPPVLTISPQGARRLGVDEVIVNPYKNDALYKMISPAEQKQFRELVLASTPERPTMEFDCITVLDGRMRSAHIIARSMWTMDDPPKYAGVVGKVVETQDEVRTNLPAWLNTHDLQTGLYTQAAAEEYIRERLEEELDRSAALAIVRLENYGVLSESYGSVYADHVVSYVAEQLRQSMRSGDILARQGGDSFLIYLEVRKDVKAVLGRVFEALEGCYEDVTLSVRMGAACASRGDKPDYETMLDAAKRALGETDQSDDGRMICIRWDEKI